MEAQREEEVENLPLAPVMPRYPTLIRTMPAQSGAVIEEDASLTTLPDQLQPPPRFPSMPDVELSKALAAKDDLESSVGRQLEEEIEKTIERDAVTPGEGRDRARTAASEQWSSMDQKQLDSLLRDMSVPRSATERSLGAAAVGDTQADPNEISAPRSLPARVTGGSFPPPLATVPMTQFSAPGEEEAQVEHFGTAVVGEAEHEDDIDSKHGAMVKSRSQSARVSITGDYGLKGGHVGLVHDSVFFDNTTLVTAGDDGKVCMWDLEEKFVRSQFEPYNGNAVHALYPVLDSDGSATHSLITLSEDRLMRVWNLIEGQAVLLRSVQIPISQNDLVMSMPVLTPAMKAHAAAAAAAAALDTADLMEEAPPPKSLDASAFPVASSQQPAYHGGIAQSMREKENAAAAESPAAEPTPTAAIEEADAASADVAGAVGATVAPKDDTIEQAKVDEAPKRFSFNIFRNKSKKAIAS